MHLSWEEILISFFTYRLWQILAGLFDQYTLAGNAQALKIMTWMVDYFYGRVQNVISMYSIERHYLSLNEETGGMNDVLYKLYSITVGTHIKAPYVRYIPCFIQFIGFLLEKFCWNVACIDFKLLESFAWNYF